MLWQISGSGQQKDKPDIYPVSILFSPNSLRVHSWCVHPMSFRKMYNDLNQH